MMDLNSSFHHSTRLVSPTDDSLRSAGVTGPGRRGGGSGGLGVGVGVGVGVGGLGVGVGVGVGVGAGLPHSLGLAHGVGVGVCAVWHGYAWAGPQPSGVSGGCAPTSARGHDSHAMNTTAPTSASHTSNTSVRLRMGCVLHTFRGEHSTRSGEYWVILW